MEETQITEAQGLQMAMILTYQKQKHFRQEEGMGKRDHQSNPLISIIMIIFLNAAIKDFMGDNDDDGNNKKPEDNAIISSSHIIVPLSRTLLHGFLLLSRLDDHAIWAKEEEQRRKSKGS